MFPKEIQFSFEKRTTGRAYVLWVKIDGKEKWAAVEWRKEPSDDEISEAKINFVRACEIYHKHINFPYFRLEIQK